METVATDEAKPKEEQGSHAKEQAENTEKSTEKGGAPSTSEASETPTLESVDITGNSDPPVEERMEGVSTDNPPTESGSSVPASTLEGRPAVTNDSAIEKQAPAHVFHESWTKLSKEVLIDKIKGVIYGQAIGDAFGLATEFLSRKAAKKHYKTGPKGYSDIIQDFHRSRWDKGDWTDDTDQMLLILRMINDKGGYVHKVDFARRLYDWMRFGFKELGDVGGMGIGMTVHRTLTHPGFLKDPHESASEVWELSGRYLAPNGAIMRTSILGILNFNDIPKVVANTVEICKVTHADPRCVASCIAVTTAIAMTLKGEYDLTAKDGLKLLIEAAIKEAEKVLEHKDQGEEMRIHIHSSLEGLKLDEQESIGYTFKALGAGFYGLRQSLEKSFRDIILEVIMEAGDADSNGAVCGALTGCVVGFKALPEDLLQFPHRNWLDEQVDNFLTTIGLKEQ